MENLKKLVSFKSDENCDKIISFLQNKLKDNVSEIQICENENKAKVVLVGINTKLENISPIVLAGHIDTVSANEKEYLTNPYELTEKDGKMFGLGSIDMKSFSAIILDNIKILKQLSVPIIAIFTTDEETLMLSIKNAISKLKKLNITPKFTIVGEPTQSKFCLCSNADYDVNLKIFGKSCHSSQPQNGTNAICACAKIIDFIEENQKKYNFLTSNCATIKGGEVINKVPDFVELNFDIRSMNKKRIDSFITDINNQMEKLKNQYIGLKYEMNIPFYIPAFENRYNDKLKQIANEMNIEVDNFSGGCEAGFYAEYSGDVVIFGVGDLALAHKPNEYVVKKEYYDYTNKLILLLEMIKKYYY